MPGTKRAAAEEAGTGATTRSAKAAKTDTATTPAKGKRGGGRKAAKTPLPATAFKSKAKPLHIHLSHTAPAEGEDAAEKDPGHLAYLALVPSSFNTGSYGWKGSKRISIELPNPEGEEEKEKVTVMLSFNATVVGSKGAKEEGEEGAKAEHEEGAEHATNGERDAEGDLDHPEEQEGEPSEKEPVATSATE